MTQVCIPCHRLILVGGCSGLLEQMNKYGVKPDIRTFTQLLDTIPSTKSAEQVTSNSHILLQISVDNCPHHQNCCKN